MVPGFTNTGWPSTNTSIWLLAAVAVVRPHTLEDWVTPAKVLGTASSRSMVLARDGRRRRGTAALRLGLYGGGLGPFRRCPQPPSAISGASFGNLRRGQSSLGNLRNEPLRVFPASYRRTMTRAISAASPQPFRPPSHALPFPRQFPSLSASFFAQLRQLPLCQRGGVWRRCNVTKPL